MTNASPVEGNSDGLGLWIVVEQAVTIVRAQTREMKRATRPTFADAAEGRNGSKAEWPPNDGQGWQADVSEPDVRNVFGLV